MKKKQLFLIQYYTLESGQMIHTITSPSPQGACRQAFRLWIKTGRMKRQPKSIHGGFKDVTVTIL